MEFVLIRHSLTPGNLEKQYVGSTDQPLAPEGEALARERRERMPEVDGLVSPLKRCRQTAELCFPVWSSASFRTFRSVTSGTMSARPGRS